MRLGKEQAAGFVEDVEVDSLPVTEDSAAEVHGAPALEPSLATS
jgi:hypothetical protein